MGQLPRKSAVPAHRLVTAGGGFGSTSAWPQWDRLGEDSRLPGGAGEVGGGEVGGGGVGGVPVQAALARSYRMAARGSACEAALHIPERHSGIECGGDERVA